LRTSSINKHRLYAAFLMPDLSGVSQSRDYFFDTWHLRINCAEGGHVRSMNMKRRISMPLKTRFLAAQASWATNRSILHRRPLSLSHQYTYATSSRQITSSFIALDSRYFCKSVSRKLFGKYFLIICFIRHRSDIFMKIYSFRIRQKKMSRPLAWKYVVCGQLVNSPV